MGHLVELRNRFVIAAIAIVLGAVGGWFLYDPVLDILQEPIRTINDTSGRVAQINFAGVASAFDMKIKLSLFIGLFISCPVWLYQVWAYIVPGLTSKEKRYSFGFLGAAVPLFLAGSAMAFFALPNAVKALTSFTPEGATNIIPAQDYLTFVMIIIVVFGIAFVLPVLMVGLNMLGILSATRIRKSWRIIVMIVFIFAAIATPDTRCDVDVLPRHPHDHAVLPGVGGVHSQRPAPQAQARRPGHLGRPGRARRGQWEGHSMSRRGDRNDHDTASAGAEATADAEAKSPAQAYAEFRARAEREQTPLGRFLARTDFELDDFQIEACQELQEGKDVLVTAPTGAGKTIIAEFAVDLAMDAGTRVFYTTPIKALSNQKFADLVAVHGAENVGLLTGDTTIRRDAPIIVMTTEVLRNMLYNDPGGLDDLGFVVLDEVHYLADRFRGPVWEEVIIHLPERVQVVSLSATVSNVEEFGAWRGRSGGRRPSSRPRTARSRSSTMPSSATGCTTSSPITTPSASTRRSRTRPARTADPGRSASAAIAPGSAAPAGPRSSPPSPRRGCSRRSCSSSPATAAMRPSSSTSPRAPTSTPARTTSSSTRPSSGRARTRPRIWGSSATTRSARASSAASPPTTRA